MRVDFAFAVVVIIGEAFGDGMPGSEIDHVAGADAEDVGDPRREAGFEAVRAGGEDAADDVVGDFGGGEVDDGGEVVGGDEAFHGAAAVAGGVEDVDFCGGVVGGEVLADAVDCWGGDAEHGDAEFGFGFLGVVDGGVFGLMWRWDLALLVCARHADDASCGVVEHTV